MRYMKNVETDEVRHVSEDDDETFAALQAERLSNGRSAWAQTGAQDADVASTIAVASQKLATTVPATATAVDYDQVIGEVQSDGVVSGIVYVPEAAITGADTNSRTLTVVNKGQDGAGTKTVATLALTNGITATAFDAKAMTLSGTAGNKAVVAGDILVAVSTHVGTGLADPGGQVRVTVDPT